MYEYWLRELKDSYTMYEQGLVGCGHVHTRLRAIYYAHVLTCP